LEQQQACEFISDPDLNSSTFAEYSKDRYACEFYDQFANHVEHVITDDCIGNYIFLADHNSYYLNTALSSSYEHHFEERVVVTDDQDLITRELEGHQSSRKEVVMVEHLFFMDEHVFYFSFKDSFAALLEIYISDHLKILDFIYSPALSGEYCFLKEFLSLLLHFRYHFLISCIDKIFSVLKFLEWLLWKFTFT